MMLNRSISSSVLHRYSHNLHHTHNRLVASAFSAAANPAGLPVNSVAAATAAGKNDMIRVKARLVSFVPSSSEITNNTPSSASDKDNNEFAPPSALLSGKTKFLGLATVQVDDPKGTDGVGEEELRMVGRTVKFASSNSKVTEGIVVCQRTPLAFVLVRDSSGIETSKNSTSDSSNLEIGTACTVGGELIKASAFSSLLDARAAAAAASSEQQHNYKRPIFAPIPLISEIGLIDVPMLTGITMVDSLTPIGRGQNMIVARRRNNNDEIKERRNMKRSLVIDPILAQLRAKEDGTAAAGVSVVYAHTSPYASEQEEVKQSLRDAGALDKIAFLQLSTTIDDSKYDKSLPYPPLSPAIYAEQVLVATCAAAIGEDNAHENKKDSLVIVDDLDGYKDLWKYTNEELVAIFGIGAIVKEGSGSEMRGFYSDLIQRAAHLKKGGTVTLFVLTDLPQKMKKSSSQDIGETTTVITADGKIAKELTFTADDFKGMSEKVKARVAILEKAKIPITESVLKKIKIPSPAPVDAGEIQRLRKENDYVDELISICDGQIIIDEDIVSALPCVDPTRSVTRIGIGADTKSQADSPAMRKIAAGLRFKFQQALTDGTKITSWVNALRQGGGKPRKLSRMCVSLWAADKGYLENMNEEADATKFFDAAEVFIGEKMLRDIDLTQDFGEEFEVALANACKSVAATPPRIGLN
jgi:F0F1-type ATP synthase alpha subunit